MRDLVSVSLALANFQFSLVAAADNCILCALFDAAAVIRRQLSTILLETCARSLSFTHAHSACVCHLARTSRLPLLAANHKNGQRAPFWVAFKVLFHFIAIYFSWFCFISLLDICCCYCFCCVLFAKYAHTLIHARTLTHWETQFVVHFFWFSFAVSLIANCLGLPSLAFIFAVYAAASSGHSWRPHFLLAFLLARLSLA